MIDSVMVVATIVLAVATIVLAIFTVGLYLQTKRANRPHISVALDHATEMGACVLSIENHGPGVAFDIKVLLDSNYIASDKIVLPKEDASLSIPFLKPGTTKNIRISHVKTLEPSENRATAIYKDVFKQRMQGAFELRTLSISEYDPKMNEHFMLERLIGDAVVAIRGPLSAIPDEIKELGREVRHASDMFRRIN